MAWLRQFKDPITVQALFLRMGRGLTPEEKNYAISQGVSWPKDPEPVAISYTGFDLGAGGGVVKVHPATAGQPLTFTYTILPTARKARVRVFGAPGNFFEHVTDSVDGGPTQSYRVIGGHDRELEPTPGQHSYTVTVDGSGSLGVQLQQW